MPRSSPTARCVVHAFCSLLLLLPSALGRSSHLQNVGFGTHYDDVIIDRLFFRGRDDGTFIDIGGNHAYHHSNSMLFHNKGWAGVVVEPQAQFWSTHHRARREDISLRLAAGEQSGVEVVLNTEGEKSSTSANEGSPLSQHQTVVQTVSLASACKMLRNNVSLLSLDVEGLELSVLKGNKWEVCRPEVIIVENFRHEVDEILQSVGYTKAGPVGFNQVFYDERRGFAIKVSFPFGALRIPPEIEEWNNAGLIHYANIFQSAASQGLLNDDQNHTETLEDCFHVRTFYRQKVKHKKGTMRVKIPVWFHQNQIKAQCYASTFGTTFLTAPKQASLTFDCYSGDRRMVLGFCQDTDTPCTVHFRNCVDTGYLTGTKIVEVAGVESTVYSFVDNSSLTLFNVTKHPMHSICVGECAGKSGGGGGGGSGGGVSVTVSSVLLPKPSVCRLNDGVGRLSFILVCFAGATMWNTIKKRLAATAFTFLSFLVVENLAGCV